MNDEWRTIPGFCGRYMINKEGDVVSVLSRFGDRETPRLMKRTRRGDRVYVDLLVDRNTRRTRSVMKLMAVTWIREPAKGEYVYPLNGDPSDTRLENIGISSRADIYKIAILKVDLEGNVIERYDSIEDAADGEYVSIPTIRYHLYGMAKKPFMGRYRFVREDGAV